MSKNTDISLLIRYDEYYQLNIKNFIKTLEGNDLNLNTQSRIKRLQFKWYLRQLLVVYNVKSVSD